jgi:uncharacterized protein (DUF1778 family)
MVEGLTMAREAITRKASSAEESGGPKTQRLIARATSEQKLRIQRAADLSGRSLTDFILDNALAAADETIKSHQVIQLTVRETRALFAALDNPPDFDEKMLEAAKRHQETVEVRW